MEKVIQPGQAGIVRITIRFADPIGSFEENYLVYSNDPRNATITLTLAGDVKPVPAYIKRIGNVELQRSEAVGNFRMWPAARPSVSINRGERFSFGLRIRPDAKDAGELQLVTKTTEQLGMKLTREKNGSGYWLDIDLGPINESGIHALTIELVNAKSGATAIKIPLSIDVTAEAVVVTPASLDFGELQLSNLRESARRLGRVGIRKSAGAFHIGAISSSLPFLQLDLQTVVEGSNYVIAITTDPKNLPRAGTYTGMLRIETDDGQQPKLEVAIKVIVADR